ncbi:bifunctional glutamate N-acetyltransferase/amino-acid acetyltransferase ArgJ [Pseudodonghicola xiamenensis]|uniref:Arginine biosynthesis bifunctional protein ArgJ n=1 Tax=Pseudodonghicola xiamenensis TaxID=337702 RepID=A0A8J3H3I1_9RHOB|nr:bifunctional glutamate N-acetyltransferase/amino-acid acetyltransferase ArgJ [Pseudodonghicola xiamenensis]GHG82725.1 arginine biosynthesis bifunctional protein ArgJ [Pseudodonghicola xiamenensis]
MATISHVSPLAPAYFPELPLIGGVRFASAAAGVRYKGRTDVMLAVLQPGTAIAGVFTKSATRSAPVLDCQAKLGQPAGGPAAILVNSGNSNAFTGHYGQASVSEITAAVAKVTGVDQSRVFTASTGVIGEPLPHEKIITKLEELNGALSDAAIEDAARAIMTTDTFAKGATAEIEIDGKPVKIAGIAKGSGMIAPDMATMLVYIFTDAAYDQAALQALLSKLTETTFNCITVDSDTSTSDSLMLAATGAAGVDATGNAAFETALNSVMLDLSQQVVRDGEGATKFVEIRVTGAASDADAKIHGLAIANSPLVKTAIAGEDPNWGRVVMAIGKSGAAADRDSLTIRFGDILVAENGWVSPNYSEDQAAAYMKGQDLVIAVDLGLGSGKATVWTCDLTHGYIEINADYRS